MTAITLQPSGQVFEAAAGTSLLQALLSAGQSLDIKCNGNASCGNCHVFIHEGRKSVSRLTPAEN
ncbi:MAG TPA: 2Fe-2S iron-sulfur cluster-binding protein, partial [Burkholderiaceae bacterium]|nr:2Fe-2S iron-sulfur cluster-binding protein [Burkholderiaceae bacterium]